MSLCWHACTHTFPLGVNRLQWWRYVKFGNTINCQMELSSWKEIWSMTHNGLLPLKSPLRPLVVSSGSGLSANSPTAMTPQTAAAPMKIWSCSKVTPDKTHKSFFLKKWLGVLSGLRVILLNTRNLFVCHSSIAWFNQKREKHFW
jgi:hypothetical protein